MLKKIAIYAFFLFYASSCIKANPIFQNKHFDLNYSQSLGYLKSFLGNDFVEIKQGSESEDIKKNIQNFYEKDFKMKDYLGIRNNLNQENIIPIVEALLEEQNSSDRYFMYHASNPMVGLLYDIYSELRRQIMNIQREDLMLCRGTDEAFFDIENIADFINDQLVKQNVKSFTDLGNYSADYAEKALSMNLFLFGNRYSAHDNSIDFFMEASSQKKVLLSKSLIKLFTYFGIDMSQMSEIKDLILKFEALLILDRGRLFQFSFAPDHIDKFVYLSESRGVGVTMDGSKDYDINKNQVELLIKEMRHNPVQLEKFSKEICKNDIDIPLFDLNKIQGRFILHPKLFSENSPLQVRSYWRGLSRNAPEIQEYKTSLKALVTDIISLILKSRFTPPRKTILEGNDALALLLKKRNIELENENIPININISDHLLSAYICSGDLDKLICVLNNENQIDIDKPIIDINDLEKEAKHSPLYLAVKYNHPKLVDLLLSKDAQIKNEASDGRNLLGWASINNYPLITQKLLNSGCNPNSTFRYRLLQESLIELIQQYGRNEILEIFIEHEDIVLDEEKSINLIKYIIENKLINLIKVLFKNEKNFVNQIMDVDFKIKILNIAITFEHTEILSFLLDIFKLSFESETSLKKPPIIKAIDTQNSSIIATLIEHGTDLRIKYLFYGTPLQYARKTKNEQIIQLIEQHISTK
ncbi:MAG: ankyrin repeat domain-containing protein [Alphaproteobacteria bacterium]|nr:ankyrin repeat domain-containing protein [Alphaproteobacteria bacterium]